MTHATPHWSDERKELAYRVASILYGVIAIMSAELAFQPGSLSSGKTAAGALLVGFAMVLVRIFVELVKVETQHGSHIRLNEGLSILRTEMFVMLFPAAVATFALVAPALGLTPGTFADLVPYISVGTVMALGFGSYYILDRQFIPALFRGLSWTALSVVLLLAKQLV